MTPLNMEHKEAPTMELLTQNIALDESWRNTVGTGGIALLISAGSHTNNPHLQTADLGNRGCCPFNKRKHH